jgi:hypothetical protein
MVADQMITTGGPNTPIGMQTTGTPAAAPKAGKRKNTAEQEAFISSLNTHGALDSGSGFNGTFGEGETNDQFAARLASFQSGGAGAPAAGGSPAVASLNAATMQPSVEGDGGGAVQALDTSGFARQGLGRRIYPQDSAALSALGRAVY